jgi:tartrate-resistant acid phosphatase type 5
MPEFHSEPYLHLPAITHKSVLIAWGAFYFKVRNKEADGRWKLVEDRDLTHLHPPRHESIGARSEPYGDARVEVFNERGLAGGAMVNTANHAWISGLEPDTEYTYRVTINGEEWGAGERRDWMSDGKRQGLFTSGREYRNRFRTHPHPEAAAPLTFAVLGDFGTGVRKQSNSGRRQREVAIALERAVEQHGVRLILTTGDNIYAGKKFLGLPIGDTGDDDDDWFFTYYQPYRYLLNRIPVYPSVGNHDSGETEQSDDRQQLLDNFYLEERLAEDALAGRASMNPGLFYRFRFGSEVEFICLDTSKSSILSGHRHFQHRNHSDFLGRAFADGGPPWRIPFFHHPPYCAGPTHYNSRSIIDGLTPVFKSGGVHVAFSGHEHNFQHSLVDGIEYFVTGGGGKVRDRRPSRFADARTVSWAAAAPFLIGRVDGAKMTLVALDERCEELARFGPDGERLTGPIEIQL